MPPSPAPHNTSSPARRTRQAGDAPGPRTPTKSSKPVQVPPSPRRTQSYTPRSTANPGGVRATARPASTRRHTTQTQTPARASRNPPDSPARASKHGSSHRRTTSSPPNSSSKGAGHILIPVPIRAKDAESPSFIRAPPGQRVEFLVGVSTEYTEKSIVVYSHTCCSSRRPRRKD
jgi:hypothetical protein